MSPVSVGIASEEMGRELLAHELQVKTVVILGREDRPYLVSIWVSEIGDDFVAFYAGDARTVLLASRHKDGTLTDDTGKRIRVWEYLGKV